MNKNIPTGDFRSPKPTVMKKKNMRKELTTIQTVIQKIAVTVPSRKYKSGISIPEHKYIRTKEKQIVHTRFKDEGDLFKEKEYKYIGRLKPLNHGTY